MHAVNWTEVRKGLLGDSTESILPPHVKLPMLPRAVTEFSRKSEDPDASAAELGAIIETDAGLMCELLRRVNSCAIGVQCKVVSAQHAINLLGIRTTRLFLISTAVEQSMKARQSRVVNFQNFANTNLERALLARELAQLLHADPDVAFSAGMLQDFLLPIIGNELYEIYWQYLGVETPDHDLVQFERSKFGWDHAQAGARIMLDWGFPDDLVCCVALHHHGTGLLADVHLGRTAAAAVAVAGLLPDASKQVPDGLQQLLRLEQSWPGFNLWELAQRVHERFQAATQSAAHYFSLLHRCEKALAAGTSHG